jgi:hypothetical protein
MYSIRRTGGTVYLNNTRNLNVTYIKPYGTGYKFPNNKAPNRRVPNYKVPNFDKVSNHKVPKVTKFLMLKKIPI